MLKFIRLAPDVFLNLVGFLVWVVEHYTAKLEYKVRVGDKDLILYQM